MPEMDVAFPLKGQQDILAEKAQVVCASSAFTSGTTSTSTAAFAKCAVGTILITTVSSTVTAYVITSVASDGKLTGKQISNAS